MYTSCAMMALSVTPPTEDKGAVEAGGATISVRSYLGLSYATLHLTVATSIGDRKMVKYPHDN